MQHDVPHPLGQRLERCVDVEAVEVREALQQLEIELVAPVPALDRAGGTSIGPYSIAPWVSSKRFHSICCLTQLKPMPLVDAMTWLIMSLLVSTMCA